MTMQGEQWQTWLIATRKGDGRACEKLLESLAVYFRRFLASRLRPDEAEDVVQEILLAVHQARHTWREGEPVTAWVHGIARYKLADHFRKTYRTQVHEIHDDKKYETFAAPDTNASLEEREDLARMLEGLTPKQVQLLTLTKVEGRTAVETSQMLGMTPTAVKVAVHRLVHMLQRRYGERKS